MKPLLIGVLLLIPSFALAAESGERSSPWTELFWSALPFVIFVAFLYFVFICRMRSSPYNMKRQEEHLARSQQHMELMERLVAAIEKRDRF